MNTETDDLTLHAVCDYTRLRYILFFSGNTDRLKSEIENLGYKFVMPPSVIWRFDLEPNLYWFKATKVDKKYPEILKANRLGVLAIDHTSGYDLLSLESYTKLAKEQNFQVRTEIPTPPSIVSGKKWNCRIYGHPGDWYIFINGEKIFVSDSQKSILDKYVKELIAFDSKIKTEWDDLE